MPRQRIIHHHATALRKSLNPIQRPAKRSMRQVQHHSQPSKHRRLRVVEPRSLQLRSQTLPLKVHRHIPDIIHLRQPLSATSQRFQACVAGWSTSNTLTPACGLRCANVSSPAPSSTYCCTPRPTASASLSSANRLRDTIHARIPSEYRSLTVSAASSSAAPYVLRNSGPRSDHPAPAAPRRTAGASPCGSPPATLSSMASLPPARTPRPSLSSQPSPILQRSSLDRATLRAMARG